MICKEDVDLLEDYILLWNTGVKRYKVFTRSFGRKKTVDLK